MNAKAIIVLQKGTLALIALLLVVAAASANPAPVVLGNLAAVVATQQSDEEDGPNTGGRKVKRTPTMRENVYRQLSEAQQAAEAEDMTTAKRIVQDLREDSNLTSYERAQVFNFLGYIHYSEGNYSAAINAYEQVIAQPDIPEGMQTQILYSIAQLSFAEEDYAKA
ncbi:MAG: tetratricopeptide repeat protein, partial [Xanthomonadales bacterium]|nr:tetratricopeptide repeat protein [Xanthomonadales bacterium]